MGSFRNFEFFIAVGHAVGAVKAGSVSGVVCNSPGSGTRGGRLRVGISPKMKSRM